jgi:hypothetical protein
MSVYGEGLYRTRRRARDGPRAGRSSSSRGEWEPATRAAPLEPVPTPEEKPPTRVGLRALEVRPGAAVPDDRARPTASRRWRCASSTSTGRGRRSRTPTPACSRSSPRAAQRQPPVIFEDGLQRATSSACTTSPAPAGWRSTRRGRGRCSTSAAAGASRSARSPSGSPACSASRASSRRSRQVPRRRHPALLRRHLARRGVLGLRAAGRLRGGPRGARRTG